ncbi:MAG: hypothetical protein AAB332_05220 [Planctomycetota bacterium]
MHKLIIKPNRKKARDGWDKAFKLMHNRKEDVLLVNDALDIEMENWDDEMRHEVYLTNLDPTTGHKK